MRSAIAVLVGASAIASAIPSASIEDFIDHVEDVADEMTGGGKGNDDFAGNNFEGMIDGVLDNLQTIPSEFFEGLHEFHTMTLEDAMAKANKQQQEASQASDSWSATETESADQGGASVSPAAKCSRTPDERVEWRTLSSVEQTAFLDAVNCLMEAPTDGNYVGATSRYEDLVQVHQVLTHQIHQLEIFLPWHRYYLRTYENMLRDRCGFAGKMPYWDETLDTGNFAASPIFTAGGFGSLPELTEDGNSTCVTDSAFGNYTLHIGPGETNTPHCLSRGVDEKSAAQASTAFVQACNNMTNYVDMENCSEAGPHAYGHIAVGAVMKEVSASPGDPTFFMHHGFVDKMFKMWQDVDPAKRTTAISGCAAQGNPCPPLTMDTVLTTNGLRPDIPVRDVMDTESEYLCYVYV